MRRAAIALLDLTRTRNRSKHEDRTEGEVRPQTVEQAIRDAHGILASAGVRLGVSKVTRLARDFIRLQPPVTFATYLARNTASSVDAISTRPNNRHGIEWADPTGETAVRNVMEAVHA